MNLMRIAVGSLFQESNTFSPRPTTLESFEAVYLWRGEETFSMLRGARIEIPGYLSVLEREGIEAIPLIATSALAGGVVTRATFEPLMCDMEARLKRAGKVDAVLLALHGAMAIEDEPDAESEIIERIIKLVPQGTPIGVSLDLHALVTQRMLKPNVFVIGYRDYPHIDMFETGVRLAETMVGVLKGKIVPCMAIAKLPMIVQSVEGPYGRRTARRVSSPDAQNGGRWRDPSWITLSGPAMARFTRPRVRRSRCTNGDAAGAQRAADELADRSGNDATSSTRTWWS